MRRRPRKRGLARTSGDGCKATCGPGGRPAGNDIIARVKRIALAPYSVRIRQVYGRDYEKLGSFATDADLRDLLFEHLSRLQKQICHDKNAKQVLETADVSVDERVIEGIVNSGEYGTETTIRDVNTWTVAHHKKRHHAEMLTFFFVFDLPEDEDSGFLLLQRTGLYGILHVLASVLDSEVRHRFPDYRLIVNPIVPSGLLEQYTGKDAKMAEIRFIRHSLSSDIAAHLTGGTKQTRGSMELVVKFKEANQFPFQTNIRRYLSGKRGLQELIGLEETKFAYDNVKIMMRSEGKPKVIDLGHPERLRATFDVTDEISFLQSGHPDPNAMSRAAHRILDDLRAIKNGGE